MSAATYQPKACSRCKGTGEEYRPDLAMSDGDWVSCQWCHGYGIEQSEHSMRHTTAVLAAYWRDGWPMYYKGDVEVHDMDQLADRDPDLPFAWLVRESGSVLYFPEERSSGYWTPKQLADLVYHENHRAYWWDGRSLVRVSAGQLHERMIIAAAGIRRARAA